ncbi:MAG: SpoIIIAH-like family protein [Clostridia bacterium]
MSKKKKIVLLVSMVLILALAAYVNIALLSNNDDAQTDKDGGTSQTVTFFSAYRLNKQSLRSYEVSQLDEIIKTEGDEFKQARADAMAQKLKLIEVAELELYLETLLKAQGFADAVVSIAAATDRINVVVSDSDLTKEDTGVIYNIIIGETNTTTDYITIQSV